MVSVLAMLALALADNGSRLTLQCQEPRAARLVCSLDGPVDQSSWVLSGSVVLDGPTGSDSYLPLALDDQRYENVLEFSSDSESLDDNGHRYFDPDVPLVACDLERLVQTEGRRAEIVVELDEAYPALWSAAFARLKLVVVVGSPATGCRWGVDSAGPQRLTVDVDAKRHRPDPFTESTKCTRDAMGKAHHVISGVFSLPSRPLD